MFEIKIAYIKQIPNTILKIWPGSELLFLDKPTPTPGDQKNTPTPRLQLVDL